MNEEFWIGLVIGFGLGAAVVGLTWKSYFKDLMSKYEIVKRV